MNELKSVIRHIPGFPKEGIVFRDITPVLANGPVFRQAVEALCAPYREAKVDVVVGVEARGFIVAPPVALALGAGFVPVRKPGKLPYKTRSVTYELEYGTDTLAIHEDAIQPGQRALLVDDLLATGGTMAACAQLVESLGGTVVACAFLVELSYLRGREKLKGYDVFSLVDYESE